MPKKGATNLEVYKEAMDILEDINDFDSCWYNTYNRLPVVAATIIYQLLKKEENKDESI